MTLADLETAEPEVEPDQKDSGDLKAQLEHLEHPEHQEQTATQDDKETRVPKDNKEDQVGCTSTLNNTRSTGYVKILVHAYLF